MAGTVRWKETSTRSFVSIKPAVNISGLAGGISMNLAAWISILTMCILSISVCMMHVSIIFVPHAILSVDIYATLRLGHPWKLTGCHFTKVYELMIKISYHCVCFHFVYYHTIRSQFCTCHDSLALVACAKFWLDWIINFCTWTKCILLDLGQLMVSDTILTWTFSS